MDTTDRTGTRLRAYVQEHAPIPPQRAALFAAELAEHLAGRHADGAVQGTLADSVRVVEVDRVPRLVLGRPSSHGGVPASDVRQLGLVLAELLGVPPPASDRPGSAPGGVPDPLWTVVVDTQHPERARRPPAAVVARRLRDVARELLLAEAPWPAAVAAPAYVPGADEPDSGDPKPASRRRRLRRTLVVGCVVAVLVVAAALLGVRAIGGPDRDGPSTGASGSPPTGAGGTPPTQVCLDPNCVAQVTFRPGTDEFAVCDKAADGFSALAVFSRSDRSDERSIWADSGNGSCVTRRVPMPDRTRVTVKACTADKPTNRLVACSEPVTATA